MSSSFSPFIPSLLRPWLRGAGELLFPPVCAVCRIHLDDGRGLPLCPACAARVERLLGHVCTHCGGPSEGPLCRNCREGRTPTSFPVRAYARFLGPWRELILLAKPPRHEDLARRLGVVLPPLAAPFLDATPTVVIPVPLYAAKRRARGYALPDRLAAALARETGLPYRPEWLERRRDTPSQVGRDPAQRGENVAGAFACPDFVPEALPRVLLVDDVVTTGATLAAAAEPLIGRGAKVVGLALARA